MGDYNRNDRGGRGGGRYGGGGGRDFRREMHRATCAKCGRDCEVPFRPRDDRPVYCSDCFEKRRNEDGGGRGQGDRNFSRPNYGENRSFSDNRDRGSSRGGDTVQLSNELRNLNAKLDKILNILVPKTEIVPDAKTELSDIIIKPKAEKPKAPKKKAKAEKVESV